MTSPAVIDDLVVRAVADQAAAADEAWAAAAKRYQLAPHGQRETRLAALREATEEVLKASLQLAAARREAKR